MGVTSGRINTNKKSKTTFYVKWTQSSQSVVNNETTINWEAGINNGNYDRYFSNAVKIYGVYINGVLVSNGGTWSNINPSANDIPLLSGTVIIPHNSDGNKTFVVSITAWTYSSSNYSGSDSFELNNIPRASLIPDISGNIGATVSIPIDRKSDSFTTTLTYSFGSLSGTIVDKTTSTSPTWTIPNTFYAQIPNSTRGTGTITCKTYNGNTQIGSDVTRTLTANAVEANANPTVSISSVVETEEKLISKLGSGGAYVNGYSKPKVTFSASARRSATLSSLTVNGISVPTNTTQYTINNINTNTITIIATDSRGYPKSATQTLTPFNNYTAPNATFTTLKRNTPTNGQIDIAYSGTWYNGDFNGSGGTISNTLAVSLQYKESGTSVGYKVNNKRLPL